MCEQSIPGYFSSPTWPGTRLIQSISTQVVKFLIHSTLLSISSRVGLGWYKVFSEEKAFFLEDAEPLAWAVTDTGVESSHELELPRL